MAILPVEQEQASRDELHEYRILKNTAGDVRAVKVGFSWPAFLLNLIWTIANGLWLGTLLIAVTIFAVWLLFSAAVQESPTAAGVAAVAAGFGLLFFLGLRGNDWLASHLESRGYQLVATMGATSAANALDLETPERHKA